MPKFMGMPLYGLNMKEYKEEKIKEDLTEEEVFYLNGLGARRSSSSLVNIAGSSGMRAPGRSSLADVKSTGQFQFVKCLTVFK